MKLEKFKEKNKKKQVIILFTFSCILLLIVVFFSSSFALFETKENFNIISGNVGAMKDISITYYIDGIISKTAPEKNGGKIFDSNASICTNGAKLRWNYEEWSPIVSEWNKTKTKCSIHFKTEYSESILNGAYPVIKEELVPVVIESDGTVKKADTKSKWYSYEEKNWANAIILKDESIVYTENAIIPEENIESYFVWIPRYRYKIFDEGNYNGLTANVIDNKIESKAKEIEIVFENRDTIPSTGVGVGEWLTHPAFTSFDSNGMWVRKFETSKSNESPNNSINPSGVQIKPNVSSWRNIQVSNAFYTSYNYKRNLESHMMKNTEWGGVAYLQHSKYGSQTSVRMNNNSGYITGYAAKVEPTCGYTFTNLDCNKYCSDGSCNEPYNTSIGYLASTTGNISGIYDMSGGSWEYVMGIMNDEIGVPMSGRSSKYNSGFNGVFGCPTCDDDSSGLTSLTTGKSFPANSRYYDSYVYAETDQVYSHRILGDATGEMGPFAMTTHYQIHSWYEDESWFVFHASPFFVRGGTDNRGNAAGIFAVTRYHGDVEANITFRIILFPM